MGDTRHQFYGGVCAAAHAAKAAEAERPEEEEAVDECCCGTAHHVAPRGRNAAFAATALGFQYEHENNSSLSVHYRAVIAANALRCRYDNESQHKAQTRLNELKTIDIENAGRASVNITPKVS